MYQSGGQCVILVVYIMFQLEALRHNAFPADTYYLLNNLIRLYNVLLVLHSGM